MEVFLNADNVFQHIYDSPDVEKIQSFEKLLSKYETLHAKYDSMVINSLREAGESAQAIYYANKILDRMGKEIPIHAKFFKISNLIHQKKYEVALEQSLFFKKELETSPQFFSEQHSLCKYGYLLYAYNLIRIGVLYKTLGKSEEELKIWKEYLLYSQNLKTSPNPTLYNEEAMKQMKSVMGVLGITMEEYIKQRAIDLSKSPK